MTRVLDVPDSTVDARTTSAPRRPNRSRRRGRPTGPQPWDPAGDPYPAELWLRTSEPYDGAVVLEDLRHAPDDAAAAQRILARYAALRLALMVVDRAAPKPVIAEERMIAEPYIDALPAGDPERRALAYMTAAAASNRRRDIAIHAIEAGDHAAHHGHDASAFWLHRIAYILSHASRWRPESLRAAHAVAAAARAGRAPKATRTWRRRARAIEQAIAKAEREATRRE